MQALSGAGTDDGTRTLDLGLGWNLAFFASVLAGSRWRFRLPPTIRVGRAGDPGMPFELQQLNILPAV